MKKIISIATLIISSIASAQTVNSQAVTTTSATLSKITDVNSLATRIAGLGNTVLYLLVGLAVIYIIWSVVHYLINPASADDKKAAAMNILWGIVGLAIIVSIWGIVNVMINTFSTNTNTPTLPNANFVSSK